MKSEIQKLSEQKSEFQAKWIQAWKDQRDLVDSYVDGKASYGEVEEATNHAIAMQDRYYEASEALEEVLRAERANGRTGDYIDDVSESQTTDGIIQDHWC